MEEWEFRSVQNGAGASMLSEDEFRVSMNVQQFKPSELSVKVIGTSIVIEGKHEELEDDHNCISRHFIRHFALPRNYNDEKIISTLTSNGILTISIQSIEDNPNDEGDETSQNSNHGTLV